MSRNGRLPASLSRLSRTPKVIPTLDWKPEANDVIIPLMGPTGAGKSTFINYIAGKDVTTVGHDLESCTAELLPVVINSSQSDLLKDGRLVLVDTPGFGDTYVNDVDILHGIGSWLETMYDPQDSDGHKGETKLAGIVYLHDISLTRMLGSTRKNLDVFQKLCGEDALNRVVLCTTKWSDVYQEDGEKRTEQLKEIYWKEMTEGGSTVRKFEDSQESAWAVIASIIEKDRIGKMDALQIQEELVEAKKLIPDTEAGRQLRYSLDELLKSFKQASSKDSSRRKELDAQIAAIRYQIRAMRAPVTQRILRLLDLKVDKILDKFMVMNATLPLPSRGSKLVVSAVGARLEADVKELIMLLGETETLYKILLSAFSAAETTIFGSDEQATTEVRCWSVKRENLKPLYIVAAPSFDSLQGGNHAVFEKVRTWLRSSCREDMKFGIIFLRSSVHPSPSEPSHAGRTLELVEQGIKIASSGIEVPFSPKFKSKTLFATFASKATGTVEPSEPSHAGRPLELCGQSGLESKTVVPTSASKETGTADPSEVFHAGRGLELGGQSGLESKTLLASFAKEETCTDEYGFDGSVASFQETTGQALKMFDIALRNPVGLDFLLEELQTRSEGATNGKEKGLKRRFNRLFPSRSPST